MISVYKGRKSMLMQNKYFEMMMIMLKGVSNRFKETPAAMIDSLKEDGNTMRAYF